MRFLKQNWSKRPLESLERRLRELIDGTPTIVRDHLSEGELEPIRRELEDEEDAATFEAQVRVLRNRLSHGTRNYDEDQLHPWIGALEAICRAHLLRLLEFPQAAIEQALQTPA